MNIVKIGSYTMTTKKDYMDFRMLVCSICKSHGDNLLVDDELCRGTNDEIEACMAANMDSVYDY